MEKIYNAYLEGAEREIAIEEAMEDNQFSKLDTMFEMVCLNYNQSVRDAEIKVFAESGTYDDLAYLIEAADEEAAGQQKNILQRIIDAIGKILSGIVNAITGIFKKAEPEKEYDVPKDTVEKHGLVKKAVTQLQTGVSKIKSGDFTGAFDLLKVIAPIAAVGTAVVAGAHVASVKMKGTEIDKMINEEKSFQQIVQDALNAVKEKISNIKDTNISAAAKGVLDKLKNLANTIKGIIANIGSTIKGGVDKIVDKVKGGVDDSLNNITTAQKQIDDNNSGKNTEQKDRIFNSGKMKFIVHPDGNVDATDKTGKAVKVVEANLPKKVQDVINSIKGSTTNESINIDDIQHMLGEEYTVELASDMDAIVITSSEVVTELSTSESIFGYDMELEEAFQESDAFDEELDDLNKKFEDLGL